MAEKKEEDKLERYELTIENLDFDGVTAISIVEFPAIEENFLVFNKEKQNIIFAKVNEDKRIITGPALIPNKEVYRFDQDTGEEYYVYFSEETVKKISEQFLIQNRNSNVTLEHQVNINDASIVEAWNVLNTDNDKANELGFKVNKGTLMISMKINNDDVWNNYIKEGKVNGFSIEGFFTQTFEKHSLCKDKEQDTINQIIELLKDLE